MPHFIKIHNTDGAPIRINVEQILCYLPKVVKNEDGSPKEVLRIYMTELLTETSMSVSDFEKILTSVPGVILD
jgi:hypothetical protein